MKQAVTPLTVLLLTPLAALSALADSTAPPEPAARIVVQVDQPGIQVSPSLHGIFFEEINRAGDGGLYAEMVRNRSFEDDKKQPQAWTVVRSGEAAGTIALDESQPLNPRNPTPLKIQIDKAGGRFGAANEGFKGIVVQKGAGYDLSLYARAEGMPGSLTASLESADGKTVYASKRIEGVGGEWKKFSVVLNSSGDDPAARLVVASTDAGTLWLDMVSLFPRETFNGHGFRIDLMQKLLALRPSFVRFPGGCFVEGDVLQNAFRWKETIGDVAQRPGHKNLWGYYSTDGLGYHEYLQLCEDLGAEPMYVINCGMAHKDHAPMDKMGEFVQDALDAIEYANGPVDSKWGALRAKAGHPAPFNMKFLEIGNENYGKVYAERYPLIYDAIKAKYPQMRLIVNNPDEISQDRLEIIDEHYYSTPELFISQFKRYDTYPRTGPKIYVGEYAVTENCGQGNLRGALAEAVFMCGIERNSEKVTLASYAPLFLNPGWRRWTPNLIVFNAMQSYGIPSYHVQQMFSANRADVILPMELASPKSGPVAQRGRIGVGTWQTQAEFKDIQVTLGDKVLYNLNDDKERKQWRFPSGKWTFKDGAYCQTSPDDNCRAVVGDMKWAEYTLSLKARKISGNEGFLILFGYRGFGENVWWNIGGRGNTRHFIELPGVDLDDGVEGKIEIGRWYDIRVELAGKRIRCFLDGKLIHDVFPVAFDSLFGVTGRSQSTGEIIMKVVNVADAAHETKIELRGAKDVAKTATATVLTSAAATDENTFAQPAKVSPKTETIPISGTNFTHTFPGNSLTVIRVKADK